MTNDELIEKLPHLTTILCTNPTWLDCAVNAKEASEITGISVDSLVRDIEVEEVGQNSYARMLTDMNSASFDISDETSMNGFSPMGASQTLLRTGKHLKVILSTFRFF